MASKQKRPPTKASTVSVTKPNAGAAKTEVPDALDDEGFSDLTKQDSGGGYMIIGAPSGQPSEATWNVELERKALSGNLRAAVYLANKYHNGLGIKQNDAIAYAWLMWGQQHGSHDDEDLCREEYELFLEIFSDSSEKEKTEAHRLLEKMRLRSDHP